MLLLGLDGRTALHCAMYIGCCSYTLYYIGGEAVWEDKGSKVAAKQVSRTAGPLTPIQIETPKQTNREVWNTR